MKDKTSNPKLKTNVLRLQGNLTWNGELTKHWERVKVGLENLVPLEITWANWEYKESNDIPFQILDDTWKIVDKHLSTIPLTASTLRLKEDWLNFVKEILKVQTENVQFADQYADLLQLLEWLSRRKSGRSILDDCFEELLQFGIKALVFTLTSLKKTNVEHASCDVMLQIFRFMIRLVKDEQKADNDTSSMKELLTSYANLVMEVTLLDSCPSNLQASGALVWCLIAKRVSAPTTALQKLLSEFFEGKSHSEATDGVLDLHKFELSTQPQVELRVHYLAAILSIFSRDLLYGSNILGKTTVAFWVLQQCLLFQQTSGSCHSVALYVARTVETWSVQVASLLVRSYDEDMVEFMREIRHEKARQDILAYLWESLESVTDQIRHAARAILVNMMRIFQQVLSRGEYEIERQKILGNILPASPHQVLDRARILGLKAFVEVEGSNFVITDHPSLPEDLLCQASLDPAAARHAKDGFSALMLANFNEVARDEWRERWIQLLLKYMKVGSQSDLKECLEEAVARDQSVVEYVVGSLVQNEDQLGSALEIVIPVLYTCKKKGLLVEKEHFEEIGPKWKGLLGWNVLLQALENRHDHVRLLAFGMISEGPKMTDKFLPNELKLCENFVKDNMAIPSSSFLQQLMAYLKKILFKVKNGGLPLKNKLHGTNLQIVNAYRKFLKNLYQICWNALLPGMNITRRGSALQILSLLETVFSDAASRRLFFGDNYLCVTDSLPILLNCFHDTYEGIQEMALELLSASHLNKTENKYWSKYWHQSLQYATSAKPPEAATASYYFRWLVQSNDAFFLHEVLKHPTLPTLPEKPNDLLYSVTYVMYSLLKEEWKVAKKSLLEAASVAPMYGLMHCIRQVLADKTNRKQISGGHWRELLINLVSSAKSLYEVVAPVVNSSSPEGYVPVEFDDDRECETGDQDLNQKEPLQQRTVSAQMLLVCCWRTVKEVSLFMGDVATFINGEENELPGDQKALELSADLIMNIGKLFISMLSEIVHRGAFEQAYAGFCKYCFALYRSKNSQLIELTRYWIDELLLTASGKSAISVTATRRSAGLPFMLQALLAPSVVDNKDVIAFNQTMKRLLALAQSQENPIVTVHSLNILRALYRDSRFAEAVMPFVAQGVQLAIKGFADSQWAVRNSSTLLFAALMTRIFGVKRDKDESSKKNHLCLRLFFLRYPELLPFLLEQLNDSVTHLKGDSLEESLQPALYPVLLILGRLTPSVGDAQWIQQSDTFAALIMDCCHSRVWKIRAGAATALTSILLPEKVVETLECLLKRLVAFGNQQNALHGTLLQIKALLQEFGNFHERIQQSVREILRKSGSVFWGAELKFACPAVKAVVMEILVALSTFVDDIDYNRNVILDSATKESSLPGIPVYSSKAIEAWYTTGQKCDVVIDESSVFKLLRHPVYEVRLVLLELLLKNISSAQSEVIAQAVRDMVCEESHPEVLALLLRIYAELVENLRNREENREYVLTLLAVLRCNSNTNLRCAVVEMTSRVMLHPACQTAELAFPWAKEMFLLSSGDSEPVEVRLAVARALGNSPGLRDASVYGHNATCLLWLALFNLLLDPEFTTREAALEIVAGLVGYTNMNHVMAFRIALQLFVGLAVESKEKSGIYWLSIISTVLSANRDDDGEELSLVFSKGEGNSYREPRLVADVVLQQVLATQSVTIGSSESQDTIENVAKEGSSFYSSGISAQFCQILFHYCSIQTLKDLVQTNPIIHIFDVDRCLQIRLEELNSAISQIDYEKTLSVEAYCCRQILAVIRYLCSVCN